MVLLVKYILVTFECASNLNSLKHVWGRTPFLLSILPSSSSTTKMLLTNAKVVIIQSYIIQHEVLALTAIERSHCYSCNVASKTLTY